MLKLVDLNCSLPGAGIEVLGLDLGRGSSTLFFKMPAGPLTRKLFCEPRLGVFSSAASCLRFVFSRLTYRFCCWAKVSRDSLLSILLVPGGNSLIVSKFLENKADCVIEISEPTLLKSSEILN